MKQTSNKTEDVINAAGADVIQNIKMMFMS